MVGAASQPSRRIILPGEHDGTVDLRRAIDDLAERLPAPLLPLARLAYNYRWTWLANGPALFAAIDPAAWLRSGGNPRGVIESVPPHRLRALAKDDDFIGRMHAVAAQVEADFARPWVPSGIPLERPVVYLCSEFAIHVSLPLYGGGLGVLAGDLLKAASDLPLPMVGVGLLYRQGYFHQRLDAGGWQNEYWTETEFERLPLVLVTDGTGGPLTVRLLLRGRTMRIQVWRVDVGRVRLYLLDTDRPDNHQVDRWISSRLYIGDRHTRLAQYAVLGIGGIRAVRAMGIQPAVVHLNEGHGALSSLERLRERLAADEDFDSALAAVRQGTIFTTHTPIPAGNEGYHPDEIESVLANFIDGVGIPRDAFYSLGRIVPENLEEPVGMTPLALRTSRASNAVSARHGEVTRKMWQPLWPDRSESEVPIGYVTNGVHTTTWMSLAMQSLLDRHLDPDWRLRLGDPEVWRQVDAIPAAELWDVRCTLRRELVEYVREQSLRDRLGRSESHDYIEAAARSIDPTVLTVGFARRVAMYKRLYLLVRFPERGLQRLLSDGPTPMQLIVAGKAHPQDHEAKEVLRHGFSFRHAGDVGRRVVFLEDYDLRFAPLLVAGVDLWLNLPRPPLEASGTSGMKVVLNGGLNLSVLDGWWVEGYDGTNGWAIESPLTDPQTQDDQDALALFDLLAREVIPLFYDRDAEGIPQRWVDRVKTSMRTLIPRFTAERMLRDYVERIYVQTMGE